MNLPNKFIAGLTAMSTVVMSIAPIATVAGDYTEDSVYPYGATVWAINNGVTANETVAAAAPFANITREQFAAIAVRGFDAIGVDLEADDTLNCEYADLDSASAGLQDYVVESCQKGLFQDADDAVSAKFNPKATVSEAVVSVIFCKALFGADECTADAGEAFYTRANEVNIDQGVMAFEKSNLKMATRGMVFQMFMNVANMIDDGSVDPIIPGTGTTTTGSTNSGFQNEVKAGNLDVTLGAGSPANMSSIPNNGVVEFAKVNLSAGNADVKVHSITFRREGLGERTDFDRVYFEKNGVRISSRSSLTSDGMVTLSFSPSLTVKAGSSEMVDLVASLVGAPAGSEHRFVATAVSSSAVDATFSVTTPTLRTTTYTVGKVAFTPQGSNTTVQGSETNYEIGRFRLDNLSNNDKEVTVKAITFRNAGDGDLTEGLMNIALYKNSTKVSNNVIINGREITFVLDNTKLVSAESSLFYIKADTKAVDSTAGDKYKFELRNSEDINAVESLTNFRVAIDGVSTTVALAEYTVEGGDLMITRDTSVATTNTVSPGQSAVILAKGTITARQLATLEDLSFTLNSSAAISGLVQKLTLRIGNSSATFTPATSAGMSVAGTFDGSFTANGATPFEITADLRPSFSGSATLQLANINLGQFAIREYASNGNQIAIGQLIGSLATVNVNVQQSVLSASRNDGLSDRSVVRGSNELVVFGASLSTTTNTSITVNSLDFAPVSVNPDFNNKITLSLYINGNLRSTRQYNGTAVTFSSLATTVAKSAPVSVQVKANINNDVLLDNDTFKFALQNINATDSNSQTVASPVAVNTVMFTVVGAGKTNVTSNTSITDQGFAVATTTKKVGSFAVQAINDNLEVRGAYLMLSGLNGYTNAGNAVTSFVIKNSAGTTVAQESSRAGASNEIVKFDNFVAGTTVVAGNSATYTVFATIGDLNSVADAGEFVVKVATGYTDAAFSGQIFNGIRLFSVNAGDYVSTGSVVNSSIGNVLNVVSAYPKVSHIANGNATDLLTFKVTNEGTTNLVISGVQYFANAQNVADINGKAFTLYNGSTPVATGTLVAGANTIVSFDSAISVAASDNLTLTMKLDAPFVNTAPTPTAGNRVFQISNLEYAQQFANGSQSPFGMVATSYLTTVGLPVAAANY